MKSEIELGDWVRFEKNGSLVIGIVQYIIEYPKNQPLEFREVVTDHGRIFLSSILEVRKRHK